MRGDFREAEPEATGPVDKKDYLQGALIIVAIPVQTPVRARQQTSGLVEPNARSAHACSFRQNADAHALDLKPWLKVYDGSPPIKSGEAMMQTLVMIPGLGSDAAIWRRTIAALEGAVDCLVGDTLSDDSLQGMARRILDQAPETFALAGVSMGGMVALQIMRMAPRRVTQLALIDTNARPDTDATKAIRDSANLLAATTLNFGELSERSVGSLIHPSASEDVRSEMMAMGARVGATTYIRQNRAVAARQDMRPILRGISVPTAVVVGSDDTLTPMELSREIHDLTPGSVLHVVPDCGHLPSIEKPEELAAILLGLLSTRACTSRQRP